MSEMKKAIVRNENGFRHVSVNTSINDECCELGVLFACHNGSCGSCKIKILEGKEFLTAITPMEKRLGIDKDHRYACQCRLKGGELKFKYVF